MTRAAIRLSPQDNIAVCCRAVMAGEHVAIDGIAFSVSDAVSIGHKLALAALVPGDKVVKYGMPIGSITAAVRPGDWVHVHNMRSDYMPPHMRDAAGDRA